jgi:hypothetical protein
MVLRLVRVRLLWWQLVEVLNRRHAYRSHSLLVHMLLHLLMLNMLLRMVLRLLLLLLLLLPDIRWWHILRSRRLLHIWIVTHGIVPGKLIHALLGVSR